MRMSARMRPNGMASGNATATMPIAMRKPLNTTGKLLTMMGGFRNRRKNLFEFHCCTQSWDSSQLESCSAGDTFTTPMAGMPSMSCTDSSASV